MILINRFGLYNGKSKYCLEKFLISSESQPLFDYFIFEINEKRLPEGSQ
jgi:hypothetical protein